MMEKIMRRVSGTALVYVSGDTTRFVNILIRSGISPLAMRTEKDHLELLIRARQFRKLHAIKIRTHVRVRLIEKRGLPFVLRRIRKRPGLPIGVTLAAALYIWLSGFYWCVDIIGEAPYPKSEIITAAEKSGVFIGAAKKNIDLPTAANAFILDLPKISWASFNSDGCSVELDFRPAKVKAEAPGKTGAYDIAAKHDGLIRGIAAQGGRVLVEVGSAVKAGQTLVSGVTVIGDPWDPEQEVRHLLSHSRAEIYAETLHTFTAACPLTEKVRRETSVGERKMLYVLGMKVPFDFQGAKFQDKNILKKSQLAILGTELPVWIETQRYVTTEWVNTSYTTEQAQRRALEKVRVLQENYLGETGEILAEEIRFSEKNGVVYAISDCTLLENIAVEVPMGGAE